MTVTLPLAEMTNAEKLELLQVIWEDLDKTTLNEMPLPEWQQAELAERERRIASGEEVFHDWDTLKVELRKELEGRY